MYTLCEISYILYEGLYVNFVTKSVYFMRKSIYFMKNMYILVGKFVCFMGKLYILWKSLLTILWLLVVVVNPSSGGSYGWGYLFIFAMGFGFWMGFDCGWREKWWEERERYNRLWVKIERETMGEERQWGREKWLWVRKRKRVKWTKYLIVLGVMWKIRNGMLSES